MIFCAVVLLLVLPLRLAAEWCGHVDAAAALARCSRAHREDGAFVVPSGEPRDADPRWMPRVGCLSELIVVKIGADPGLRFFAADAIAAARMRLTRNR